MAFKLANRAKVLTSTTGTGPISLGATAAGFQSFAAAGIVANDTVRYTIEDGSAFEIGVGTIGNSLSQMARSVTESSNSDNLLSLSGNANVFLTATSVDLQTAVSITGGSITGMSNPTAATDVATKLYVDGIAAAGVVYHTPVKLCTTANTPAGYSNGSSGVGATLTNSGAQAVLAIDGVAAQVNDRVLFDQQTNGAHDGIYTVTSIGSASSNWVVTRATDADSYVNTGTTGLGEGSAVFVSAGNVNSGELHVCNVTGVITFGTTDITFVLVSDSTVYTAGTGVTLSGTTFSIGQDVGTSANVTFAAATVEGNIAVTGTVDGIDIQTLNTAVVANTAKVGITTTQRDAIIANSAKVGITTAQGNEIVANNAKVGITTGQANAITANTAKTGITSGQANAITANTSKVGITTTQRDAIIANSAKVGITTAQANEITANNSKVGISTAQSNAITANTAKVGITTTQRDAIIANSAKVGITTAQANEITANNSKVGITTAQSNAITANTAKTGITTAQSNAITANTAKVGITTGQANAITANTAKTGITSSQANAITANGNLAAAALPKSGGAMSGAITTAQNVNLSFNPNAGQGSGAVVFMGDGTSNGVAGRFKLNCSVNSHGITIQGPPHSASANYTLTLPNTDGTTGQFLQSNGSGVLDWADAGGAGAGVFYENAQSVTANYTITANKNAMSAGVVTIASGVTVTVPSGSRWSVV